jgi:hypothetical protein
VEELDLHPHDLVVVPLKSTDLLGHMDPEMVWDLDVSAGDNDLHADFPRSQHRLGVGYDVCRVAGMCPRPALDR